MEASVKHAFGDARVFIEPRSRNAQDLVTATLVAGSDLGSGHRLPFPNRLVDGFAEKVAALEATGREARDDVAESDDDQSDLDLAESELRVAWRRTVMQQFPAEVLDD
jgi:hypothetical protein